MDAESKDHVDESDLDAFEDDFDLAGYREQRLQQLKRELDHKRDLREIDHGKYTELIDEPEVIRTSANEKLCVIHFYHRNFQRCKIMDKHLEELAPRYFDTRFIRVFVENVPWLVEKLAIKVLPCVVIFIEGIAKDRIIGFEGLGSADDFETNALEMRLKLSGVLISQPAATPKRSMYADDKEDESEYKSKIRSSSRTEGDDDLDL